MLDILCDKVYPIMLSLDLSLRRANTRVGDRLWWYLQRLWFNPIDAATGRKRYYRPRVKLEQSSYSTLTHARGVGGELAVKRILESKGYEVKRNHPHGPDLVVEGRVSVEVKTSGWCESRSYNGGYYSFNTKWGGNPKSRYDGYVLVLRCLSTPPVHFVIPRYAVLEGQQGIKICTQNAREHKGKWHEFRECWSWIDAALDNSPNNCIFTRLARYLPGVR